MENQPKTISERREYSPELVTAVLGAANSYLQRPESRSINLAECDEMFDPKRFQHENPIERLVNTYDESSKTSFLVETVPDVTHPKAFQTIIRWYTMGEQKGDLPGGWIAVNHREGNQPKVTCGLGDFFPPEGDESWKATGGLHWFTTNSMWSNTDLSPEQVQKVLDRLDTSRIDTSQTDQTLREGELSYHEDAFLTAAHKVYEARKSQSWLSRMLAEIEYRKQEKIWESQKKRLRTKSETNDTQSH